MFFNEKKNNKNKKKNYLFLQQKLKFEGSNKDFRIYIGLNSCQKRSPPQNFILKITEPL